MAKVAIYGAGGFGKEVRGILDTMPEKYSFAGFIDDFTPHPDRITNEEFDTVLIAIANPSIRKKLVAGWTRSKDEFATLIAKDVTIHPSNSLARGAIICQGVKMTVNVRVGEFVIVNLNATIGHDCIVDDYVSIMPSANISGNVRIGNGSFVGSGATILQNITIGSNVVIGAGSVVTRNIVDNAIVMGVPARVKKYQSL